MTLTPRQIERSPEQQIWDAFIKTIKTLDEGRTPAGQSDIKTWSVRNEVNTLRFDEYRKNPESINLSNRVYIGGDTDASETHKNVIQDTTMSLFFSPTTGSMDEIRMNTKLGTISFDNGIRRGPEMKSFHFKLHVRQEFSLDGTPKLLDVSRPDRGNVELYIEAQAYEGGGISDSLNSFAYYNIEDGKLVPLSGAIADLTRNRVDLVHEIMKIRTIDQADQTNPDTRLSIENGDSMRESKLMAEPQKIKPEYTIRVHEETLEVLFNGTSIGAVRVLSSVNPTENVSQFLTSYQETIKGAKV